MLHLTTFYLGVLNKMATCIQGKTRSLKQVDITLLFVHISPSFLEHVICSTLFSTDGQRARHRCRFARMGSTSPEGWEISVVSSLHCSSLSLVFTEPGRWKLWEEGRRKMRQAIKSPSMTDTDLDIGSPIYCSC